ncbi:LysR family transcriptional regulator [Cupriavidus campinensis]
MNPLHPAASSASVSSPVAGATGPDRTLQLAAFNAAFAELGLRFRWDMPMFEWLCGIECEKTRVARYVEEHHAHLLNAYDAPFLSQLIFDKKNEYLRAMSGTGMN